MDYASQHDDKRYSLVSAFGLNFGLRGPPLDLIQQDVQSLAQDLSTGREHLTHRTIATG